MLTDTGKTMEEKYTLKGLIPDPTKTELTFTRFFQMAERYPDNVALSYLGLNVTYKKLTADIDRFAAALAKLGVGHGDRVMLYLGNCPSG